MAGFLHIGEILVGAENREQIKSLLRGSGTKKIIIWKN